MRRDEHTNDRDMPQSGRWTVDFLSPLFIQPQGATQETECFKVCLNITKCQAEKH